MAGRLHHAAFGAQFVGRITPQRLIRLLHPIAAMVACVLASLNCFCRARLLIASAPSLLDPRSPLIADLSNAVAAARIAIGLSRDARQNAASHFTRANLVPFFLSVASRRIPRLLFLTVRQTQAVRLSLPIAPLIAYPHRCNF